MAQGLLILDMPNDDFPDGEMMLEGCLEASEKAGLLLDAAKCKGTPISRVQRRSARPNATIFHPDTHGVKIRAHIRPLRNDSVIQKHFPNSAHQTPLQGGFAGTGSPT